MSRLGQHRTRPALSEAAKAKPQIEAIEAKIREAKRARDDASVVQLEVERAWLVMNSMR